MSHVRTTDDSLICLLKEHPSFTDEQIASHFRVSRRTAARMVADLKSNNRVLVQRIRYKVGDNWVNRRIIEEIGNECFIP